MGIGSLVPVCDVELRAILRGSWQGCKIVELFSEVWEDQVEARGFLYYGLATLTTSAMTDYKQRYLDCVIASHERTSRNLIGNMTQRLIGYCPHLDCAAFASVS